MRILALSPSLWADPRRRVGMPVYHHETAGLARAGARVTLLLLADGGPRREAYEGVRVIRFPVPGPKWGPRLWPLVDGIRLVEYLVPWAARVSWLAAYTASVVTAGLLARFEPPQVIYAHTWWSAPAAAILALRFGVPFVVRLYGAEDLALGADDPRLVFKHLDRWACLALPAAAVIVTDDGAWTGRLAAALGLAPERVYLWPNGVEAAASAPTRDEARAALGLPAGVAVVATLSRLAAIKRIDRVVRAFAEVLCQRPEALLVLPGDGGEAQALRDLARRLGLAERVRFTGPLDRDGVARLLAAADVLVTPYAAARFSNQFWEGLAAGCASVVVHGGEGQRYVQDGQEAVLIEEGRDEPALVQRLTAAILRLLEDRAYRTRIASAARAAAARRPRWDERLARELDLLARIAAAPPTPRRGALLSYECRQRVRHGGLSRRCPVCGAWLRRFAAFGSEPRPEARCPICNALERHRLLWLYLARRTDLLDGRPLAILHIAPEPAIARALRRLPRIRYVSGDLTSSGVALRLDLGGLPFAADRFDAVIANHVLEHVPDDRQALREIWRVLRPGGWAIAMVPLDGERTLEDPSARTPEERLARFGQADHVRSYGRDLSQRLAEAGFAATIEDYARSLDARELRRYGLIADDVIPIARKGPGTTGYFDTGPCSSQGR